MRGALGLGNHESSLGDLDGDGDIDILQKPFELDVPRIEVWLNNGTSVRGDKIDVRLQTKIGDRTIELKKTITSTGPGVSELTFPIEISGGERCEFELAVTGGDLKDSKQFTVPIRRYGLPVYATAGGSSAQDTIVFVEHDKALAVEDQNLELVIGPSITRTLLDAVTGSVVWGPQRIKTGTYSASPVLVDGKIYATSEDGVTSVVAAKSEFELIAENDLGGYTLSSPAVSDGQIFIRTESHLYCIGERPGA